MRATAWSVPAVSMVSTAPAFARSTVTAQRTCTAATLGPVGNFTGWSGFTKHQDTGWYYRPEGNGAGWTGPTRNGYVNADQYQWYDEYIDRNTHSFLSFKDAPAASNTQTQTGVRTITLEYTFQVPAGTGTVVNLSGGVIFGYGNQGTATIGNARTDRQMVTIEVVDGTNTIPVAKMAPRRKSLIHPDKYFPDADMHTGNRYSAATQASYDLLQQTDEQVASAGYTLHEPGDAGNHYYNQGRFLVPFSKNDIELTGTTARTVRVRYTLTLPNVRRNWVNDDVILRQPTLSVCVP